MDISKLQRDPAKIHAVLRKLPDGRVVTTKSVKIYIPSRFAERGLAFVGVETNICGIYAMVLEDTFYCISLVNAMVRIEPSSTLKVMVGEEEYYEFGFNPGETVFSTVHLVKKDTLVYQIYDEIISKGRVPWYIGYTDLGRLFDTAPKHAGTSIGSNNEVTELLVSMIARDAKDRHKYYRTTINSPEDLKKNPPAYISMRSVQYAATNTTNKIAGSYFDEGIISALNSPADRVERIESILRR